jgi:hypothetical protein
MRLFVLVLSTTKNYFGSSTSTYQNLPPVCSSARTCSFLCNHGCYRYLTGPPAAGTVPIVVPVIQVLRYYQRKFTSYEYRYLVPVYRYHALSQIKWKYQYRRPAVQALVPVAYSRHRIYILVPVIYSIRSTGICY